MPHIGFMLCTSAMYHARRQKHTLTTRERSRNYANFARKLRTHTQAVGARAVCRCGACGQTTVAYDGERRRHSDVGTANENAHATRMAITDQLSAAPSSTSNHSRTYTRTRAACAAPSGPTYARARTLTRTLRQTAAYNTVELETECAADDDGCERAIEVYL